MTKRISSFEGLLLCGVLVLSVAGCGRGPAAEQVAPTRPAMPVEVARVQQQDVTRTAAYVGSVEPVRVARMASPAEGPIEVCAVREGDHVKRGQLLVRLGRSRVAGSGLAAAREELSRQEADYKRIEQLVTSGALPGEQLEMALSALRRTEAQLAGAETSAEDYEIRAPWDGVVSMVWIAEGNYVSPRTPLLEIYDPDSLRVRFSVPERDARQVTPGMAVTVALDAWPDRAFTGEVERVFPRLDAATRTLTVEAALDTEAALISGLFARVTVPLEVAEKAVAVPSGAPVALPGGGLVVYVAKEGVASQRPVVTGLESGGFVQILEGVEVGEMVVVRGQESLRDGAPIRVLGGPPPARAPAPAEGGGSAL